MPFILLAFPIIFKRFVTLREYLKTKDNHHMIFYVSDKKSHYFKCLTKDAWDLYKVTFIFKVTIIYKVTFIYKDITQ